MSFRLYVGNYPMSFTEKDLQNLFQEFPGITIDHIHKKDRKCYAFIVCKDIDQLVSVIEKMNNADVSGRKLKVRASDRSLQEYVELLFQETNDNNDNNSDLVPPSLVPLQVMRNEHRSHQAYETDGFEESSVNSSLNGFQRKRENNLHESAENKSCHSSRVKLNSPNTKSNDNAFDINSFSSSRSQNNYPRKNEKTTGTSHENDPLLYQKSSGSAKSDGCLEKKVMRNEHRSHQAYETDRFEQSSVNSSLNGFQRKHENNLYESAENKSCHSSRVKLNSPNTKNKNNNNAFDINSLSSSRSQNNYPQKHEKTTGTSHENDPLLYQKSSGSAKSTDGCHYPSSPSEYSYQQRSEKFKNQTRVQYEESAYYSHSSSEYEHDHDYYTDEYNGVSPRKNYAKNLHQKYDEKEFTWVSVTNFPIGCSVRSIYELFNDYDPIRVNMICNVARRDKTLTEAHVCFWNQDIANDVILNYDNTMFQGRVILVNDLEDLTMMKELLDVAHS